MPTIPPIVNFIKYLFGCDVNGVAQSFQPVNAAKRGLCYWDGSSWTNVTGANGEPLILPDMEKVEGGSHPYVLIMRPSGQIMGLTTPAEMTGKATFKSDGGNLGFFEETGGEKVLPNEGIGLVGYNPDGNVVIVGGADAKGLYYINGDGQVLLIGNGSDGQTLKIINGAPAYGDPASGSAVGGFPGSGLRAVIARNTSVSNINVKAPSLAFKSSVDASITTIDNIDVNVSIAAAAGPGGIDTGAVSNAQWYYVWAVNNGVTTDAMLSLSAVAPSEVNAAGYTLSAFVGMAYVEGTGDLRPFIQKGVKVVTPAILAGNNMNITNAYAAVPVTAALNTLVPPNAVAVSGLVGGSLAETEARMVSVASATTGIGEQFTSQGNTTGAASYLSFKWDYGNFLDLPLLDSAAPVIYWKGHDNVNGKRRLMVTGFVMRG